MSGKALTVLVVGPTGSIGHLVVDETLRRGHSVRALVRDMGRARDLPPQAECVVGDLTKPATLMAAVEGIDANVFTHGGDSGGKAAAEQVDYGGVRNVLRALGGRTVRIALMTAIGVTDRTGAFNRATQIHDWKRRGERLVRASCLPYTIVRPGWFDLQAPGQDRLVFLQGDARHAGNPSDGVIARRQIAEVLGRRAGIGRHRELLARRSHGLAQPPARTDAGRHRRHRPHPVLGRTGRADPGRRRRAHTGPRQALAR